jgi:hypothetical protein
MKLDEFISDILITTGSKDYLGFMGGKGRISEKISLLLSPTKGPGQKTRVVSYLAAYIGPKNDRTLGISTPVTILKPTMPAQLPGLSTETCTVKYYSITEWDLLQIADTWFYDYSKEELIFCNETVSLHKFCHQLITILEPISDVLGRSCGSYSW